MGEGFGDRVGDGVEGARGGLSHMPFELGEELFDRIEVGRVFGKEQQPSSRGLDGGADRLAFMRSEIVEDDNVVAFERRNEELLDIGEKQFAIDWAVEQTGRFDPSLRSAARNVAVFQ